MFYSTIIELTKILTCMINYQRNHQKQQENQLDTYLYKNRLCKRNLLVVVAFHSSLYFCLAFGNTVYINNKITFSFYSNFTCSFNITFIYIIIDFRWTTFKGFKSKLALKPM